MAYTRQYPNSITPQGTTTRGCLENDDKELKRVLDLLSNVGGLQLSGTKRQCVLYGPTDASGNPNFLTASGLTVSIDGSTVPVILSFANGFSISSGTVDSLAAITSAVSNAWIVPANGTYYLYIDKDMSTGLISYGVTASPDTYSKVAPTSPVLDQCYFNTNEMKMYHYNGNSWEQKWRVFVGKGTSTASEVTINHYPQISRIPLENEANVATLAKAINLDEILSSYAKLASPALTGIPTAPTAALGTNTDQIATMAALLAGLQSIVSSAGVNWSADGKTFACPSLGISGLMDTNGYISLGKLFGGLILQWGTTSTISQNMSVSVNLPVSFDKQCLGVYASRIATTYAGCTATALIISNITKSSFNVSMGANAGSASLQGPANWISIGI